MKRKANGLILALLVWIVMALLFSQLNPSRAGAYLPALNSRYYLPAIRQDPTETPTFTPVPTRTSTPTFTPTSTRTSPPNSKPPVGGGHTYPGFRINLYVMNVDPTVMYNMGCEYGKRDLAEPGTQDSLVILDFGKPIYKDGWYGAYLMSYNVLPASVGQIALGAQQFAYGYYWCTGNDLTSHLRVGLGVNNYKTTTGAPTVVNFAHGAAWAQMVNQVNAWLVQNRYSGQVDVVGANDIELSWNSYAVTRDWLNGYDSTNNYDLYNFGAVEGCPTFAYPGAQCGNSSEGFLWTREQVWDVIYGAAPVYPLPEIYRTNQVHAQQWYLFSVYSYINHGYPVQFVGSLTTYAACKQEGGCSGAGWSIENTPYMGWSQLHTLLNQDARTGQGLRWATDMCWTDWRTNLPAPCDFAAYWPPDEPASVEPAGAQQLEAVLGSDSLSAADRAALEEKLEIQRRVELEQAQGRLNPAEKTGLPELAQATPVPPVPLELASEIVEGSEGFVRPFVAQISNLWRGMVNGEGMMVLAGSLPWDNDQGAVIVFGPGGAPEILTPSQGAGSLRIIAREGDHLRLSTPDGATLLFSITARQFLP